MTDSRLLDPQDLAEAGPAEAVRLPLDLVEPNPANPRRDLIEIDALAENIKTFGLLQPVTVRRAGDRYQLLGGHRRRAAFALLSEHEPENIVWRSIPAVIRNTDDDDRAFLMLLSGQLHGRAWAPREEAAALERLVVAGRSVTEVGEALNKTRSWASKRLRVYADSVLSGYVQSGQLAPGVAEEFLLIKDPKTRQQYADRAVKERWSQDQARGETRALRLDRQLRETAKRARELLTILSSIEASQLPTSAARDLWALHGRIELMATGKKPVFPTIEAAQEAAGVREKPARRRRSSSPKRSQRTMPRPG